MSEMPVDIPVPYIVKIGLNEGLKEAVVKLYTVLSSSQLDDAAQQRFEMGLQKTIEAYMVALNVAQRKV
jgi:hypothetical protein